MAPISGRPSAPWAKRLLHNGSASTVSMTRETWRGPLGEVARRRGPHRRVLPGVADMLDAGHQVAMARQRLRQRGKAHLGGERAVADDDQALDGRRRGAVDRHGLRKRPHGNRPGRLCRRVVQREVGGFCIRRGVGHRHLAKARLGSAGGRQRQRKAGGGHDEREDTKGRVGVGAHGGRPSGWGCAAGMSRRSLCVRGARVAGRATKCRSGGAKCPERCANGREARSTSHF
jgi:hypothetical protein